MARTEGLDTGYSEATPTDTPIAIATTSIAVVTTPLTTPAKSVEILPFPSLAQVSAVNVR